MTGSALELPVLIAATHAVSLPERAAPPPLAASLNDTSAAGGNAEEWRVVSQQHEQRQAHVRAALRADPALSTFADAVGDPAKVSTLLDVPPQQQRQSLSEGDARWARERFSPPVPSPPTDPLPPPTPQPQPPPNFQPTSLRDLLSPEAWVRLQRFLVANKLDMEEIRAHGAAASRRFKPTPLVLAQSDLVPAARGIIWDLRKANQGIVVPVDFTAPIVSDLNLDLLEALLRDSPDKELIGHMRLGAHFKSELALHTVLLPHMDSIGDNFDLVSKELERLQGKGWHEVYGNIPFFPVRLMPNGTVARKLEAARPRRTTNLSAPHRALVDADGEPVVSLNAAIKAPDASGRSRFPKERKPTVCAKLHDLAILKHLAWLVGDAVFGFCLDFADFFSQIAVAPAFQWLNVVHWLSPDGDGAADGCFVVERKLGFGCAASSGIAQRLADGLVFVFRRLLDAQEKSTMDDELRRRPSSKFAQWIRERRSLGRGQCRRYEISQYTDDPLFCCVSVSLLTSGLKLFLNLMRRVGLELSHPRKFQVGASLRWLGLDWLLSPGILLVPTNKRLRAITDVQAIVREQPTTFQEYRSVVSFLTYLRPFVSGLDPTHIYGIFDPLSLAQRRADPSALEPIMIPPHVRTKLTEWLEVLQSIGGVFFVESLEPEAPIGASQLHLGVYGDAALEGDGQPGIGGYAHGLFWQLRIDGKWRLLPISVLEFVALVGNVLVFEPIVGIALVTFYTDSRNCYDVLRNSKSRSKLMQLVHTSLLRLPAYQRLRSRASTEWCAGPANPAADAISRFKMDFFQELCAQLGVRPRQLPVPDEVVELLERLCVYAADLKDAAIDAEPAPSRGAAQLRPRERAVRFGEAKKPGPPRRLHRVVVTALPQPPPEDEECKPSLRRRRVERPPQHVLPTPPGAGVSRPPLTGASGDGKRRRSIGSTRPPLAAQVDTTFVDSGSAPPSIQSMKRSELANAHASQLCGFLLADPSPLALKPRDAADLRLLCSTVLATADTAHSASTLYKDNLAWKRWGAYCRTMNTPPIRDDSLETNLTLHRKRESMLLTGFLLYCKRIIPPRSANSKESKPQSAMNMVHSVVRTHKRLGIEMSPGPLVSRTLTAICKEYVAEHGPESLVPARKEPLGAQHVRAILLLPNGTPCGRTRINWEKPFFLAIRAMLATMLAAGFRKAEASLPDKEQLDGRRLRRSSVSWRIRGIDTADPTEEQLLSMAVGDYCILSPPLAKNDGLGLHFSWRPIYLPFNCDDVNAARALRDLWYAVPIEPHLRSSTLLFCISTSGTPMRHAVADKTLRLLLLAAFPGSAANRWSWHSLRIGCACALLAAGASMALIQAICRWRSISSIEVYARLGAADYGTWVLRIQSQRVDATTARNLPRLDYDGIVAALAPLP